MMLMTSTPSEGRAVKAMLAAKGRTQGWLAEQLNVDPAVLSRVLSGQMQRPDLWRAIWLNLTSEDPR